MKERKIGNLEIRIGIGIVMCLFLSYFVPQIQRLAACTAVLMCMQDVTDVTFKSGFVRLKGVICGGIAGIAVVFLDNIIQIEFIFFIFCGIGIVVNLVICAIIHMPAVTRRVSAITFCLVVLLSEGNGRIYYAVNRFIGTLAGACVALVVTFLWCKITGKDNLNSVE